jgi:hypothetical protein
MAQTQEDNDTLAKLTWFLIVGSISCYPFLSDNKKHETLFDRYSRPETFMTHEAVTVYKRFTKRAYEDSVSETLALLSDIANDRSSETQSMFSLRYWYGWSANGRGSEQKWCPHLRRH